MVVRQIDTYSSDGSFLHSERVEFDSNAGERSSTYLTRTGEIVDARTGERTVIVRETQERYGERSATLERRLGEDKYDPPATDPGNRGGINRTVDPSADTHDANVCWEMPWVCRGAPMREPTLVNPGKEPGGFASAPRINPGDSIVVNPSTEHVRQANQARGIDQDTARRAVSKGTQVNPPGPND